jgi:hypothetical protein
MRDLSKTVLKRPNYSDQTAGEIKNCQVPVPCPSKSN